MDAVKTRHASAHAYKGWEGAHCVYWPKANGLAIGKPWAGSKARRPRDRRRAQARPRAHWQERPPEKAETSAVGKSAEIFYLCGKRFLLRPFYLVVTKWLRFLVSKHCKIYNVNLFHCASCVAS